MVPGSMPARHHPDAATTKRRLTTSRRHTHVRITAHTRATRAYLSPSSAAPTTASHPLSSTLIYRPRPPSLLRPLLRRSTFCPTVPVCVSVYVVAEARPKPRPPCSTTYDTNVSSSSTDHREGGLLSRTALLSSLYER